jgi:hypothetical protein
MYLYPESVSCLFVYYDYKVIGRNSRHGVVDVFVTDS